MTKEHQAKTQIHELGTKIEQTELEFDFRSNSPKSLKEEVKSSEIIEKEFEERFKS